MNKSIVSVLSVLLAVNCYAGKIRWVLSESTKSAISNEIEKAKTPVYCTPDKELVDEPRIDAVYSINDIYQYQIGARLSFDGDMLFIKVAKKDDLKKGGPETTYHTYKVPVAQLFTIQNKVPTDTYPCESIELHDLIWSYKDDGGMLISTLSGLDRRKFHYSMCLQSLSEEKLILTDEEVEELETLINKVELRYKVRQPDFWGIRKVVE